MPETVYSVTQLNRLVRSRVETDPMLLRLAVQGEVTGYKRYPSGYHYFSLKDEKCVVNCVITRMNASRLRFLPENGKTVLLIGSVTLYEPQGKYQFTATDVLPVGEGALEAEYERLRAKLEAEGLFDPAHKKPLPPYPERVAVVTSASGAVIHDILRTLKKTWPAAKVLLLPVAVQGAAAPGEIVRAIRLANLWRVADVMIVGRGGGSREELWAFNDEGVARAIYASEIPVVSAVGHEPDVTIADYVADRSAHTPTAAAELVGARGAELRHRLSLGRQRLERGMQDRLDELSYRLDTLAGSPAMTDPDLPVGRRRQALETLASSLSAAMRNTLSERRHGFARLASTLDALSPLAVLGRGYALAQKDGIPLRGAAQVRVGDRIDITLAGADLGCLVEEVHEHGKENV